MEKQKYRQGVISVFKALEDGKFSPKPETEIIFKQPFNNLGLGFAFSFTRNYFSPYAPCQLSIINPSNEIVDAFSFDPKTYKKRPLIEIRAGYSDVKMKTFKDLDKLKVSLDKIYTGHPTFGADNKTSGGRVFNVRLNDIVAVSRTARVGKQYKKGRSILSVLDDVLKIAKVKFDLNSLIRDPDFPKLSLENTIFYNNRQIMTQVLPSLAKKYGFKFYVTNGVYEFRSSTNKGPVGVTKEVSEKNRSMIEHPVSVNFVHWKVKTFFGRPKVFDRGEWMKVVSNVFTKKSFVGPPSPTGTTVTALIVNANYSWQNESASIEYVISPSGQPINSTPELSM